MVGCRRAEGPSVVASPRTSAEDWVAAAAGRMGDGGPRSEGFSLARVAGSWRSRRDLPCLGGRHEEFLCNSLLALHTSCVCDVWFDGSLRRPGCRDVTPSSQTPPPGGLRASWASGFLLLYAAEWYVSQISRFVRPS